MPPGHSINHSEPVIVGHANTMYIKINQSILNIAGHSSQSIIQCWLLLVGHGTFNQTFNGGLQARLGD